MRSEQRLTDRKREAIIQAAIVEFRVNGFDATSVDSVAARADVSKRTLYNHFPSKDALFEEILEVLWLSISGQPELPYRSNAPMRDQLLALLMQKMELFSNDEFLDLARVAIVAGIHSPQRVRGMIDRLAQKEGSLLGWIRAAQRDGRLTSRDAALAAQQLESIVKGAAFWPQVTTGRPRLKLQEQRKVAAAAVDLFLSRFQTSPPVA